MGEGRGEGSDPEADGKVRAPAVAGSCVVAGGDFTTIGGSARSFLAAFGCECADPIFADGFESGDSSGWSRASGNGSPAAAGSTIIR